MTRSSKKLVSVIALIIAFWLIWSKVRILIHVSLPWWGLLLMFLLIYVLVEHLIEKVLG